MEYTNPQMDFEPLRALLRGETPDVPDDWQGGFLYPYYAYYIQGDDGILNALEYWAYIDVSSISFYDFPGVENIRKTERYKAIVLSLGLVDYWRERGWPKFCWPVGDYDFECGAAQE